ncbi:LysR family transcriptional regulator [Chelonobacter oris]|uniref:LysR family transcriptional regulator n=1 Tax=Chelonobacter oris TaxID=505317 RepID=UPI00244CC233|nr:LysR family transcriptional regulator [Chelonobacter oris]MDH3000983.1 LysR family transcriptional regulator [Chelonobacter oris]
MHKRENYNDLYSFLLVAREKNFSKAAAKLGISSPALSKAIRLLEQRLGLLLFHRTTRSVSLTQAGEQLFRTAEQSFNKLDNELNLLEHYRHSPSGLVRINCALQPINTILIPKLAHFAKQYPDIRLEMISENRFVDIVADGFDAGIRLGADVAEDMIAVKISDVLKMAVVATPSYFEQHGFPRTIEALAKHNCIAYRLSDGGVFTWEFNQNGKTIKIKPQGQWIFNDDYTTLTAAKKGLGIAYLPESLVAFELGNGQLIRIFIEQSQTLPALYLYYPHRNASLALRAVIDALRIR